MFHDWPDELVRHLMCMSSSFSPDILRLEGLLPVPPATMLKDFKEELSMVTSANPTHGNMFKTQFLYASAVREIHLKNPSSVSTRSSVPTWNNKLGGTLIVALHMLNDRNLKNPERKSQPGNVNCYPHHCTVPKLVRSAVLVRKEIM